MSTPFTVIQKMLDDHLNTLDGLPTVQLENKRLKTVTNQPFVRATLMPTQTEIAALGVFGYDRAGGMYQVDCYYPIDDGATPCSTMADNIIAHFNKGLVLTSGEYMLQVDITFRETARALQNFYNIPVIVTWHSYK